MRQCFLITILLSALCSCGQQNQSTNDYPENVGDIALDKDLDDPTFKVCNEKQVPQYYNFGKGLLFKGEKPKIVEHFKGYKGVTKTGESGFITIRFIINCEGKTGRFRVQEMDNDYTTKSFNKEILKQIVSLTKTLEGWGVAGDGPHTFDYYQYLTFKIEDGKLIEIMP
jgi:hypothetical protein